jgi:hypothetical protein
MEIIGIVTSVFPFALALYLRHRALSVETMNQRMSLLSGIGLGAGLLYFLDLERGRERRARLRMSIARIADTTVALTGSALQHLKKHWSSTAAPVYPSVRSGVENNPESWTAITIQHRALRSGPSGIKKQNGLHRFFSALRHADAIVSHHRKIPLWLKISYTLFLGLLVPVYAVQYGIANFLWFSDIALLATLVALWRESRWPRRLYVRPDAVVVPAHPIPLSPRTPAAPLLARVPPGL